MALILNDLHIGVNRSGGTTPQSQLALRDYLRDSLANLLATTKENCVIVNGDLFDGFTVDINEVINTYVIFSDWLQGNPRGELHLVAGNHDWNPRGDKISSFHLLCFFLKTNFEHVHVYDKGYDQIAGDIWSIPHMPNQALFDIEIEKACSVKWPEDRKGFLLLHCNYKNKFAENSDHSLNISDDQVAKLMIAGWTLIIGHEHKGYSLRGGRIIVSGNQFPSSIADCIGEKTKSCLIVNGDKVELSETWGAFDNYAELDWREVRDGAVAPDDHGFIRFVGEASAAEASDVIGVIARARQKWGRVFVVTNAVKVEGVEAAAELAELNFEATKAFDVLGAILEQLDEAEAAKVKELLA